MNWWVFVKYEPKSSQSRTKDLNYFSLCVLDLIHEFHNWNLINEINELSHDILIYWDAPVCVCVYIYIYTVGTESIQTPLNFSLFVILQPFAKII